MNVMHPNLDKTLLALADSTRRAILQRLSQGEARVTELAEPFDMSLNSVSKHIRVLERAQLIKRRVAGREHLLSFNRKPLDEAAAWIANSRAAWTARLAALDEMLVAEDHATAARTPERAAPVSAVRRGATPQALRPKKTRKR
jgi:DNA-binding transcriptional ArsR family regulator